MVQLVVDGSESNGFVLTSDANGVASWVNPGSLPGVSEWTDTGSEMHPNEITDSLIIGGNAIGTADIILDANGGAIFNQQSNAVDFRVEGDNNASLLFADGSTDRVGIHTKPQALSLK